MNTNKANHTPRTILQMGMGEFWSGDIGLTLVSLALIILIFIVFPLRETGLPGRIFLDVVLLALMIFGAMTVNQSRVATAITVVVLASAVAMLMAGRFHPTALLHEIGSVLVTAALLMYARIVLLVMFRAGPVTWSRIQGGVSAYLLIGLACGSAYEFMEDIRPGSFHFTAPPADIDQLTAKLTYFSFSTLTTVGFGDITPIAPFARSLAIAEAIVGQLFPAILIGALVAMAIQSQSKG